MTLHDQIVEEIKFNEVISFSRFMELALYHPSLGFYATGGAGRRKDFITSPETGPLFGKLVSKALDKWWHELGTPEPFYFIEVGAGTGTLAKSILRSKPSCLEALHYIAVEINAFQRSQHPEEIESLAQLPDSIGVGVIFANELLDNLPFDIYQSGSAGDWQQVCIGQSKGSLHEVLVESDTYLTEEFGIAQKSGIRIPDQVEARHWLAQALRSIEVGRIVAIDYALESFPSPENHQWLRTYRRHGHGENPLIEPGAQDITTDVDISQLGQVRTPDSIQSQHAWLTSLGISGLVEEGKQIWFDNAANPDVEALAARSRTTEAQALLDLKGLGGFQVIEWGLSP
ncbi:MAG: SAM-dependent methyltransferase [Actinomycetota bacterium]|nr:SAM-dependent methyltransferase [Actinomycetota bacterium]